MRSVLLGALFSSVLVTACGGGGSSPGEPVQAPAPGGTPIPPVVTPPAPQGIPGGGGGAGASTPAPAFVPDTAASPAPAPGPVSGAVPAPAPGASPAPSPTPAPAPAGPPPAPAPSSGGTTGAVIAPIVAAPPPSTPQPGLAVDYTCVHTGGTGTREFNVGGPGGSPNQVTNINDVPWETLNAGDTVRIHWRSNAYAERLALFRSGTQSAPIRVCGVPGPARQRPFITGIDATTRTAGAFGSGTVGGMQPYGVVTISGRQWGERVEHVVIEGLRIGDTKTGPGRANTTDDDAFFTDASGQRRRYEIAAACIRLRQAHNITIRNNEITNCGDGLFAQSLPDNNNAVIRNLLVEGNYLHGSAIIGNESRHQAYLQGVDITVQGNYFGPTRSNTSGVASGNQLKMRAAGLVVRYNYLQNGARTLDLVEAEEHIPYIAPWKYARLRAQYLGCQQQGCLRLGAAELAEYDARQAQDWAKYQNAYVYGNLIHVVGRTGTQTRLPGNLVHYGFDNSQHDRQPGTLWFFNNTVLWETDRDNMAVVRLFDYGSDYGDGGYYGYSPALQNVNGELHYLTSSAGEATCQTLGAGCVDWGRMLQTRTDDFGTMRSFHNALVRLPYTPNGIASDFELTRNRWDKMDITGPMWISAGWNVDSNNDSQGGGFGRREMPAAHVYAGGNDSHHVAGTQNILSSGVVPIDRTTFVPVPASPLRNAAAAWPTALADSLKPAFSVTIDPAVPGSVTLVPRTQWSTIGAVE